MNVFSDENKHKKKLVELKNNEIQNHVYPNANNLNVFSHENKQEILVELKNNEIPNHFYPNADNLNVFSDENKQEILESSPINKKISIDPPNSQRYYAVRKGRNIGIFTQWKQAQASIKGLYGAQFKKFLTLEEAERFMNELNVNYIGKKVIDVYCDGSVPENGYRRTKGGIGIVFGEEEISEAVPENRYGSKITNNIAELYAISRVFDLISDKNQSNVIYHVYTDSKYSINSITAWCKKWKTNDWKDSNGKEIKNLQLIKELSERYEQIKNICDIRYVKGHSISRGNTRADALARDASGIGSMEIESYNKKRTGRNFINLEKQFLQPYKYKKINRFNMDFF